MLGLNCCFDTVERDALSEVPAWFYHDAGAALVRDGEVLAAVEEERLNRIKHTNRFSGPSAAACCREAGVRPAEIDRLAFFFEEGYTDNELNLQYVEHPEVPLERSRSLIIAGLVAALGRDVEARHLVYVNHHLAHATATFFHSGFSEALVAIIDGNGENASTTLYDVREGRFDVLVSLPVKASLGHLYSTAIELLGYRLFDEYKVMGLAPHGDASRYRPVFRTLYELGDDGTYEMDFTRVRSAFLRRGFRPRRAGEGFSAEHRDFAAALQETLETLALHVLAAWRQRTGHRRLCLAGGVVHNSSMNGAILRSGLFEQVFAHPAAHDAGASLGAAMHVCRQEAPDDFRVQRLRHVFWGPAVRCDDATLDRELGAWRGLAEIEPCVDGTEYAAEALASGLVVGWVHGRAEFGPRALGHRSILADPRPADNRERINAMVKKRESYRPFAPAVLEEAVHDYFVVPPSAPELAFMVFVLEVRPEARNLLGAVTHVDGTARVQTVSATANPTFWRLLRAFADRTGLAVLLNTSFNNFAEPIVQDLDDAVVCLLTTALDVLIVGKRVVRRRSDVDVNALAEMTVGLGPRVAVCRTVRPGGTSAVHEVRAEYAFGPSRAVDAELAELLERADGRARLGDLADAAGQPAPALLERLRPLWEARLLRISAEACRDVRS